MKLKMNAAAAAVLAASLVVSYAYASDAPAPAKKTVAKKEKAAPAPSVADQIDALRQQLQGQIDGLKSNLADKDAQLKQAQEKAAAAQAEAARAQAAVDAQQQAVSTNGSSVQSLQATIDDMKNTNSLAVGDLSDQTAAIRKSIASPDTLHYKGITLTPSGFTAAETVYRTKATGGDIPTAFSAIPYAGDDRYSLSEFFGSARQSRLALMAEGKLTWATLRGYWEADFLGTGISSNNNQSNSYVMRQRVIWGQLAMNNGWAVTAGQLWSLATEGTKGISTNSGDIKTPQTIDPNYVVGFVWTRQLGLRLTKTFAHSAYGVALENPQLLYSASLAGDTPYAILGSAGANGGNYNAAISGLSGLTTYVKSYSNLPTVDNLGNTVATYVPNYATIAANSNIANLSFNQAPDVIVKAAFDPGWGHYEVIGIAGFAHETVYPGVTQNTVKYGGVTDIMGFNGAAPGTKIASSTTAGSYVNSIVLGGVGASFRVPLLSNKVVFGAKGLYGPGMGRYGNSTLSDVTNDASGNLKPIHNLSSLVTLEANPNPRLSLYLNYGIDYAARADYAKSTVTLSDPKPYFCQTGVTAANAATFCSATPTPAMFAAGGSWGSHFTNTAAIAPVGYGSRYASVSGTCSAKSVVTIKFIDKIPPTTWNDQAPDEYGFYSNVNPNVDHPRWSQRTERRIGLPFYAQRKVTLMFNGYADQVASMYTGMDLKKFF